MQGKFDLVYLPIDFKNKCNVGYAFVNFIHYSDVPSFCDQFHGKKWDRFNSDKVCFAPLPLSSAVSFQGSTTLVTRALGSYTAS